LDVVSFSALYPGTTPNPVVRRAFPKNPALLPQMFMMVEMIFPTICCYAIPQTPTLLIYLMIEQVLLMTSRSWMYTRRLLLTAIQQLLLPPLSLLPPFCPQWCRGLLLSLLFLASNLVKLLLCHLTSRRDGSALPIIIIP
jgi:hypothetical protein